MTTTQIEALRTFLLAPIAEGGLPHVQNVNRWTKEGKDRMYIDFKSYNGKIGTRAVTCYVDLISGNLFVGSDWSGSITARNLGPTIETLREYLATVKG